MPTGLPGNPPTAVSLERHPSECGQRPDMAADDAGAPEEQRLRRLSMRQLPGGHVKGVDGAQRVVGGRPDMQRLVHDQGVGEVGFLVALADPEGGGVPERLQGASIDRQGRVICRLALTLGMEPSVYSKIPGTLLRSLLSFNQ